MAQSFAAALRSMELVVGTWLQINNATAAEVLANAGFDWIAIDIEHTDIDASGLTSLLRGMYGRPVAPIARVSTNDVLEIRRALDAGSRGVLVPFVSTPEEARRAVDAAKYPPRGIRGFSFSRANNWGKDFAAEAGSANDETVVIVMIESRRGAESIREILAVDGVDAAFIGPYDLSGSFGIPGQIDAPPVRDACSRVLEACRAARKPAGILLTDPTPENVGAAVRSGYTLLALGLDTSFIASGARRALDLARAARRPAAS